MRRHPSLPDRQRPRRWAPSAAGLRIVSLTAAAGLLASPVAAAPSEGCTKGPAEAIRSGDMAAAEDALRKALADSACGPVAPDLRLRLAQILADGHDGKPGPACEAMGLFRRIAAESEDALVQSDAAARADRLTPICAGEAPKDTTAAGGDPPAEGAEAPGIEPGPPPSPPREPGAIEWGLVGAGGGMLAVGAVLIGISQLELADRDAAHRDYLAAPFGSADEKAAAERFEDEQTQAQILLGSGLAAVGIGAALGIIAVTMWPDSPPDPVPAPRAGVNPPAGARLQIGPGSMGVVGWW